MIRRRAQQTLMDLLSRFPAVALLGPRQVGKTTLAHTLFDGTATTSYLDLELPSHQARLSDPEDYCARHRGQLIIIDEIQRRPDLLPILRGIIDGEKRGGQSSGQFLLLGSSSLEVFKHSSESLAGRLATLELTPFLV